MTGAEFIETLLKYINGNQDMPYYQERDERINLSCDITWDNFTYRNIYHRHDIERVQGLLKRADDHESTMYCDECYKKDKNLPMCKEFHEFVRQYRENQVEYDKAFAKYLMLFKLS